jgi:hypothetical protein
MAELTGFATGRRWKTSRQAGLATKLPTLADARQSRRLQGPHIAEFRRTSDDTEADANEPRVRVGPEWVTGRNRARAAI